ncbi:MAG TPA: hypothetical protein VFD23_06430, partial [Clostridia bacterium]|nr:hypothetical protein [Clostridia bacterium]
LKVNELKIPLDGGQAELIAAACRVLKCSEQQIKSLKLTRKSVDSRDKSDIFFVCNVEVEMLGNEKDFLIKNKPARVALAEAFEYDDVPVKRKSTFRPVIAGFGPAGMFAALTLAQAGLRPIVLERGRDVDARAVDVKNFWQARTLDENSNMQFGEGGAGTFSDGKLTTGIKDKLCRKVLLGFAENGAPEQILYSSKPHIGTDKLRVVIKSIREKIISLGGEVCFESRLTKLIVFNSAIHGITYTDHKGAEVDIETDALILAIGHSARDTVEMLYAQGIKIIQKPFSVGARIEHPREMIDKAQYGKFAGHPALGAAEYKLSCHPLHGRGAYTFCMCPGGTVVTASSEKGGLVVNGMSTFARNNSNSNSALLVGIATQDFGSDHPLAGIHLQRTIEQKAFKLGGSDYTAPAQLVGDFLKDTPSTKLGGIKPSCPTGVAMSDIRKILPINVTDNMAAALVSMNRQLVGFAMPEAVLTAAETRSSSPVRILRDEFYQAEEARGLYPCGEGAGYAGGIVSAGVDGIRCALAVMQGEG